MSQTQISGGETSGSAQQGNTDAVELAKFQAMAEAWWDPNGDFKPLHRMHPTRVRYVREAVAQHYGRDADGELPLDGLRILDVGCGGGLLSESLTRLGANVTGIDAVERNVEVAKLHAADSGLTIDYRSEMLEALVEQGELFDAVVSLEVIEHVARPDAFIQSCVDACNEDGLVILSTFNKTLKSFGLGIVAAEYVLGWLPKGTHDWEKFVRPEDMARWGKTAGMEMTDRAGMGFNPLSDTWRLTRDTSVNYIATLKRMPTL